MSEATAKLRADYSQRKTALEQERQALVDSVNAYITQVNKTISVMDGRIADVVDFLKFVDSLEADEAKPPTPNSNGAVHDPLPEHEAS